MDMDMGSGSSGAACKISMVWNWYTIDACFLAEGWHIENNGMFAATCIGVILLVVVLEFMRRVGKEYDQHILNQFQRRAEAQAAGAKVAPSPSCLDTPQTVVFRASPLQQLTRSVIHAVTFGIGYIVMLLAMYFNGYIIICIIIGAGIGKFLCDWMTQKVVVGKLGGGDQVQEGRPRAAGVEEPTVCCG